LVARLLDVKIYTTQKVIVLNITGSGGDAADQTTGLQATKLVAFFIDNHICFIYTFFELKIGDVALLLVMNISAVDNRFSLMK
jgi:hypothetical protein